MRFTGYLFATLVTLLFVPLVAGGQAQAADCPSQQTVVPYDKGDPPYQCAQMANSGKKSLGTLQTKSWTNSTHVAYKMGSHCFYNSSSSVSVIEAWEMSSYTATATNWSTSGTRHYAAGVIWKTGGVNDGVWSSGKKCADSKGHIKNSILRITSKVGLDAAPPAAVNPGTQVVLTGYMSPSDAPGVVGLLLDGKQALYPDNSPVGGKIENGKFKIVWMVPNSPGQHKIQVVYGGESSNCPTTNSSCGFSKQTGKKYDVTINGAPAGAAGEVSSGQGPLLSSRVVAVGSSSPARRTGLTVKTRSGKAGKGISLSCPEGSFPIHGEIFGGDTNRSLIFRTGGIALRQGSVPSNRRVSIQLTCRERGSSRYVSKNVSFGTVDADQLQTSARGSLLLGGPGADRLLINHKGGVANGGLGRDRIVVRRKDGVALGGPGRDLIRSRTSGRTLLVGGPGRDRIIAGGRARVNAKDGERDVIVCKGPKVLVRADRQDRLVGPCRRI